VVVVEVGMGVVVVVAVVVMVVGLVAVVVVVVNHTAWCHTAEASKSGRSATGRID